MRAPHMYFRHWEILADRGWVLFTNVSSALSMVPGTQQPAQVCLLSAFCLLLGKRELKQFKVIF